MSTSMYNVLGEWDNQGVPKYLAEPDDIDPEIIQRVQLALPEYQPINQSYLDNTKTRNLIIKADPNNYNGTDVYMTFVDEGAGYLNTIGYYVYDLNDDYTIPTKLVNDKWVPMTFEDGKTMKKYIVFPNFSMNGTGNKSGGNMKPGYRVKLLYNPSKPEEKFPNNIGIGFFLIPNGWNNSTKKIQYVNETIYSDIIFNRNQSVQTVLLNDNINLTETSGQYIIGFEDIARPSGDSDFNDAVIKITYESSTKIDTNDLNLIPLVGPKEIKDINIAFDKSGCFLQLPQTALDTLFPFGVDKFRIYHKIKSDNAKFNKIIYDIFKKLVLENDGYIDDNNPNDDIDGEGNKISFTVVYKVPKNKLNKYIYLMKSINNRWQISDYDPNYTNIVQYQNFYINHSKNNNIVETLVICNDIDIEVIYFYKIIIPDISSLCTPLALGDPHITTIKKYKYELPNITKNYVVYDDKNLYVSCKIDNYPNNNGYKEYEDLTFFKLIYVKYEDKEFYIDMFSKDTYYDNQMNKIELPDYLTYIDENSYSEEIVQRKDYYDELVKHNNKNEYDLKYIKLKTKHLGDVYFEIFQIFDWRDMINGFGMISNGFTFCESTGILVSPYGYKSSFTNFPII